MQPTWPAQLAAQPTRRSPVRERETYLDLPTVQPTWPAQLAAQPTRRSPVAFLLAPVGRGACPARAATRRPPPPCLAATSSLGHLPQRHATPWNSLTLPLLSPSPFPILPERVRRHRSPPPRRVPGAAHLAAQLAGPAQLPACRLPPRASRRGRVPDARSYTPRPPPPSQPAWLLPVAPRRRHDTPSTPRPLPRTLSPSSVLPAERLRRRRSPPPRTPPSRRRPEMPKSSA